MTKRSKGPRQRPQDQVADGIRESGKLGNNAEQSKPVLSHQPNLKLDLPYGVKIAGTSLVFSRELSSSDEWISLGRALCQREDCIRWLLGHWWCCIEHRYGERKAIAMTNVLGREYGTLANYGSVFRKVETSRRRELLSFTHHVLVAPLEPDEQTYFLNIAEKDKLKTRELKDKIAEAKSTAYLHRMNALDGNFINDEDARDYVHQLENATKVPKQLTFVPPWERTDLEDYLERHPFARRALIRKCGEAVIFYSKSEQFVRQIEREKASRVDLKQLTKHERLGRDFYWLDQAAEVPKLFMGVPHWKMTDLEDYLVGSFRPAELWFLAKKFEEAGTFFSNTARSIRQLEKTQQFIRLKELRASETQDRLEAAE